MLGFMKRKIDYIAVSKESNYIIVTYNQTKGKFCLNDNKIYQHKNNIKK